VTERSDVETAAGILREASRTRRPVDPLTQTFPALTVADAWEIQRVNRDLLLADGRTVAGYKVGLTSQAMQVQMGVGEPDFGVVLDDMVLSTPVLELAHFVQPRVEAEIALVLREDLGAGATTERVLELADQAMPSLEIIDSRIRDWRLSLIDTVADNASSGAIVLGSAQEPSPLDLAALECVVSVGGAAVASGLGSAALGHPAAAAAWLARRLAEFGEVLTAGSVVMTGSLHASFAVAAGDEVVADFGALGVVRLSVR
jgi:2-keto-4-pentenoate hydratase